VLCTEVERMSALWENLDKQLKSKIFDLSAMEEKLGKAMTEVRAFL
jgi:E3 ubiquitin-protein ligase BRE1